MDKQDHTVTGERMTPGGSSSRNEADHLARYKFAETFVKDKSVLDIACGTGFGVDILSKSGASSVLGVDIDQSAISYAVENYGSDKVKFVSGSAESIEAPDNSFDVIVSFETIEHLEDELRSKYLDELFRTLKPDGVLLLSTPNKQITSPWQDKPNNPFHILEYTKEMLKKEVEKHGFKIDFWYGQRFVQKWKTGFVVRKMSRLYEKITKSNLKWYDFADSEEVRIVPDYVEPRYFLIKASK